MLDHRASDCRLILAIHYTELITMSKRPRPFALALRTCFAIGFVFGASFLFAQEPEAPTQCAFEGV
jgi:hypothetical protein